MKNKLSNLLEPIENDLSWTESGSVTTDNSL